ncbi:MFS transporter [Paenibacillus yanchengensis]|uniref:MFS transporter n=1 Tax=Paenibacillus yanchengensis TaxID=2035833 RepID=A0ABW4YMG3_9BACL
MTIISKQQRVLFITITLLYWISMYIYVPTLSPYLSSNGYSLPFIGIVLGSYGLMQMLIRFPLGIWSDTFGKRKPFIILGMFTAFVSCILFLIPDFWLWPLAGRIVAGICASTWVAFTVMYASFFSAEQTGKAMGNISFMTVSGQLIGMLLSTFLAGSFHPTMPFIVGAVIAIIGLILAMFIKEPAVTERAGMSFQNVRAVVKTKLLWHASILSILAHSVLFITMFGFTPLKAAQLGASGWQLTLLVFSFMVPHGIASLITSTIIVKRYGQYGTIVLGFVFSGLCTAAMVFIPSMEMLYMTQALNGFAQGMHMPLFLGMAISQINERLRATAMGLYQAIYASGMFAGPFIAGFLNERWSLNSGFIFGAFAALVGTIFALYWRKKEQSEKLHLRSSDRSLSS